MQAERPEGVCHFGRGRGPPIVLEGLKVARQAWVTGWLGGGRGWYEKQGSPVLRYLAGWPREGT